ncbi:hypothetical protein Dret_1560 [Desulfohalobium retbaense DSM 5692]|uniref:Uncharacterized protein n=1 Tax=Desulfohalobium retbaense (strain ATCC 49708 / DSM 5692 / JCM 16813 / HR100) TaxID=485915 RepID=C8X347_DESRD|nr:hypothetical protein Dret_1560 [Desulfohalobium retbaense DSM 5692]
MCGKAVPGLSIVGACGARPSGRIQIGIAIGIEIGLHLYNICTSTQICIFPTPQLFNS